MRKILFAMGIACLLTLIAPAQEVPRNEVFGGYSYVRTGTASQVNAFNNNGGLADLQYNFNEYISGIAELGGYHAGNISIRGPELSSVDQTYFSYQFGPRFSVNKTGRYAPFVHFLVGGVHESRSFAVPTKFIPAGAPIPRGVTVEPGSEVTRFGTTQNAYAMTVGGGFDIRVSRDVAIRPFQLDYLPTHFSPFNIPGLSSIGVNNDTRWQQNLRFSVGVTVRFGENVGPTSR